MLEIQITILHYSGDRSDKVHFEGLWVIEVGDVDFFKLVQKNLRILAWFLQRLVNQELLKNIGLFGFSLLDDFEESENIHVFFLLSFDEVL